MVDLRLGNCAEVMQELPAASIDSIITDPPYGLSFMGKDWDHGVPGPIFWEHALRVAKPGAHLLALFPGQAGAASPVRGTEPSMASNGNITGELARVEGAYHQDAGSAARFFYCAKASRAERNAGLSRLEEKYNDWQRASSQWSRSHMDKDGAKGTRSNPQANHHSTVKPMALMQYLCRITRPPSGGLVLDPFMGSGTTGCGAVLEGRGFIGIELEQEYLELARARIDHWSKQMRLGI